MSNAECGWELLLNTDSPSECVLKAALFTTYDRADDRFLAEHLLPLLLKLSRDPDGEGVERQYFLLELDRRLTQLHDKLVVVSSTTQDEPTQPDNCDSSAYGWIWRSIRYLTVGSHRRAVQHAKLWLLHWGAQDEEGGEFIEIVVSSANLTLAAFKGQIQAAWRARIELHQQASEVRQNRWGVLPAFLQELADSAGDDKSLVNFVALLARADCPEGITFVASVPGTYSRQELRRTPWGSAGLRKIVPPGRGIVSASILSPFIGSWNAENLSRWCASFEGSADRLELAWIDTDHPWARTNRWLLPQSTLKTLIAAGATLLQLRYTPNELSATDLFHEEHRAADDRWSHAKVYSLRRGTSRRLLVTSANFSPAAWGRENSDGSLTIENFELGVCIDQAAWRFEDLNAFDDETDAATVDQLPRQGVSLISWVRATWDGKKIDVECRCEADCKLFGEINGNGKALSISKWTVGTDGHREARVPWTDANRPPLTVQLTCLHETVNVPVFDERPLHEREATIPPEVDEDVVERMRDELLFEQYGGRIAIDPTTEEPEDDETPDDNNPEAKTGNVEATPDGEDETAGGAGRSDSYAIPAFVLARRHLGVIDNWVNQVTSAVARGMNDSELQLLRRDAELLIHAFTRQAARDDKTGPTMAIGAKLAAEELGLRVRHFPEG